MATNEEAKMYPKSMQLARGAKKYHRKVASPKRWAAIIDAKAGPCRVCLSTGPVEYHHLVPRAIGGSDCESNIVPLCSADHQKITNGDREALTVLRLSLTDAEYSYSVETLGEARFEQRFRVEYRKP